MSENMQEILLELARSLDLINREIERQRKNKGKENLDLRKKFYDTSERIKQLLSESPPLDDIRDPMVRKILKWVRDGNHYPLDIESKNLIDLLRPLPFDVVVKLMNKKGILVSEKALRTGEGGREIPPEPKL